MDFRHSVTILCDSIIVMDTNRIEKISRGRCLASSKESANGDRVTTSYLPDDSLAFILSDGMGKGKKAAEESRIVTEQLKRLLKEGVPAARAIKAVNKAMVESKREGYSFATVDLTIIEKDTGRARFYKMGAATSFLVREGNTRRIEHPALPVGILPKLKLRAVSVDLKPGDVIVMVSDGVTEADRKDLSARWLQNFLCNLPDNVGPINLANQVVTMAKRKYGKREKDDLSALVIMIQ